MRRQEPAPTGDSRAGRRTVAGRRCTFVGDSRHTLSTRLGRVLAYAPAGFRESTTPARPSVVRRWRGARRTLERYVARSRLRPAKRPCCDPVVREVRALVHHAWMVCAGRHAERVRRAIGLQAIEHAGHSLGWDRVVASTVCDLDRHLERRSGAADRQRSAPPTCGTDHCRTLLRAPRLPRLQRRTMGRTDRSCCCRGLGAVRPHRRGIPCPETS